VLFFDADGAGSTNKFKIAILQNEPSLAVALNLHYSPITRTLIVRTSQKTDCFLDRSLDELTGKAFENFSGYS
jgi:hypothetical protein